MKKLTPNIAVKDIKETVAYYQKHFDFTLEMAVADDKETMGPELLEDQEYIWAMVSNGDVAIMFQRIDSIKEDVGDFFDTLGASATFYIEVEDVDGLYAYVQDKVEVIKEPETLWYGQREFYIKDCNGYVVAFSTTVEE